MHIVHKLEQKLDHEYSRIHIDTVALKATIVVDILAA